MIKIYDETSCKGRGQIGIDCWYPNGQLYACLQSELGIKVRHFSIRKDLSILKSSGALLLQAKLPNPAWFSGCLVGEFDLLGGLAKGPYNFMVDIEEECEFADNALHSYTIVAIDGSGLESDPAHPLTVVIPKTSLQPPVEGLGSYVDRKKGFIELYWKPYKYENVSEIMIYKSMIDKPATLLRNVAANVKRIVDNQVKPNNEYVYLVRVVFKDGQISETAKLNIKY